MTVSDRLLRALLRAYPSRVRARFGDGMRDALSRDLAAARARGPRAAALFWIATMADVCRYGAAERRAGFPMRGTFTVDWRDAWRSLRAAPMVTAFAVVSLALGIGGVTALFSILNSLALKPLPVRDPSRLVLLDDDSWTNPIWEAVRERRRLFAEDAFAWATPRFNLSSTSATDMVEGIWASGGMFDVLGVRAAVGRTFTEADDVRGGGADGPVAVISHALWQRRFGGAPDVVGKHISIERVPFTIIGVTPRSFFGPDVGRAFDVAVPIGTEPLMRDESALDHRSTWWLSIMARLKPGQTPDQATALLEAVRPQIRDATIPPLSGDIRSRYLIDPFKLVPARGGRSPLRSRYEQPLTAIMAVVGLVLLIACANVANLLIARASTRRHELTLRLALGASRWRIARQLLVESVWLALAGAVLGVALARWGSGLLVAQLSSIALAIDLDLGLDWRVLAFTTAVSAAAALLFGVAPALSVSRLTANEILKQHGRGGALDRRGRMRHASVVLQVALSLALIVGAGLFVRTYVALETRQFGFDRHGVLLVSANIDRSAVRGDSRFTVFSRFEQAVRALPGVAGAAISFTTPAARGGRNAPIAVPPDSPLGRRERMAWVNLVTPGWFETMGMRLAGGRDFDARDRHGAPAVAVVNRAFARRFLPGVEPVGARIASRDIGPGGHDPSYEIVGVVEDTIYRSLRAPMEPVMYLPFAQEPSESGATIAVRAATGPPEALARSIVAALEKEDAAVVLSFRSLDDQISASLTQERLIATLAGFFGVLGLLLAAVGLYGVTAHAVTSRRAEIGIRMALGASADGVVALVLRRVAGMVGLGIVLGAALSLWAAKFIGTLLYGLDARDPVTFAAAAALLAAVATLAAWVPARRASRIDPMRVLRNS
ncbi:MAG TPA: ABC transporter permease [Vicinamibacterales bacterium]|nr:ABC transporter permease [Vicinamibacterales bacterium]